MRRHGQRATPLRAHFHARRLALERLEDRSLLSSFTVSSLVDGAEGSLRDVITKANALAGADEVIIPAGTYNLTLSGASEDGNATGDLDVIGELTITGAGAATTIIDGQQLDRIFDLAADSQVTISGVTMRNGDVSGSSGGILAAGSEVGNSGVAVQNGSPQAEGGAIRMLDSQLSVTDCVISENKAWSGGALYARCSGGSLTIARTQVLNNRGSSYCGGIQVDAVDTDIRLDACVIRGNSTVNAGGGAWFKLLRGSTIVADCTIAGNSTLEGPGGMQINLGEVNTIAEGAVGLLGQVLPAQQPETETPVSFTGCTFTGNQGEHGALSIHEMSNRHGLVVTMEDCTVAGNTTQWWGGGIVNYGTLILNYVTIAGNTATQGGAGLVSMAGSIIGTVTKMQNTLLANNVGLNGEPDDLDGEVQSLGHNLVGKLGPGVNSEDIPPGSLAYDTTGTNLLGVDPKLGPLADNGGPTQTMALLAGSPAINAAANTENVYDQRGVPRPQGTGPDIGAYEYLAAEPGDTVPPTIINVQRYGYHRYPTKIVLTFSEPMDQARAQNLANFQVSTCQGIIRLASATYDAATRTVTLVPRQKFLQLAKNYRITVSGLTDGAGNLLDGNGDGIAGDRFTRSIGPKALAGPIWPIPIVPEILSTRAVKRVVRLRR